MVILKRIVSFLIWIYVGLVTVAVFTLSASCFPVCYFIDRKRRVNEWCGFLWGRLIIGWNPFWSVTVAGQERLQKGQVYVMISNHQSLADILVLCKLRFSYKWISKEEIFRVPLLGQMMHWAGDIHLERGGLRSIRKALQQAAEWLERGVSIMIFPEGTRATTGEIGPFKDGAFLLAVKTQKPIVPIVVAGTRDAMPKGSFVFRSKQKARVEILPPVPVAGLALRDVERLKAQVYQAMVEKKRLLEPSGPESAPTVSF